MRAALHKLQQKTEGITRSSGLPSQPMNRYLGMLASLFALTLIQACTGNGDSPTSQQNAKRDVITQEEGLIVTTLNEVANAESQFTVLKTPHPFSVSTHRIMQESGAVKPKPSRTRAHTLQRC